MKDKSALRDIVINLINHCSRWIELDENGDLFVIDPLEKKEITGHYGHTHLATSLLIYGKICSLKELSDKGKQLLISILNRWNEISNTSDFHSDFNVFALSIAYQYCNEPDLRQKIKSTIIKTRDSNHDTINWLPMRAYVNLSRYEWTNSKNYLKIATKNLIKIQKATNSDGGIEDLLPFGTSYNLQYNISTLAGLFLLKTDKKQKIEIEKQFSFILDKTLPDGDVNYQGRGANQVFGWGPWIYLLSSSNHLQHQSFEYFKFNILNSIKNNNIFLNQFSGGDKTFWWDYHHTSVYHSHLLFWCCLALRDYNTESNLTISNLLNSKPITGINIIKNQSILVATFQGRSKYLAELGPIINSIWTNEHGVLFKCSLGPFGKPFGEQYGLDISRYLQFGLIGYKQSRSQIFNKLMGRLIHRPKLKSSNFAYKFEIKLTDKTLKITFLNPEEDLVFFNFPISSEIQFPPRFTVYDTKGELTCQNTMKVKSQYGWLNIIQSHNTNSKKIIFKLDL